jgi:hypothetical protein
VLAAVPLAAQETIGSAEIAAQGFYAPGGVEPVRATTGLAVSFRHVLPSGALLEGRAEDYASSGLRLTENYLKVRGLKAGAWKLELSGGDLMTPGRPMDLFLPQVYTPHIRLRGLRAEGIRGRLSWTGYAGVVTFLEGPRLPFSVRGPQNLAGGVVRWKAAERLEFAGQLDTLGTDAGRAEARPYLMPPGRLYARSAQATLAARWKAAEGVEVVGEAAYTAGRPRDGSTVRPAPGNGMVSGTFERGRWLGRASWLRQTAGYLPVAGYFAGDRGGGFVEGQARALRNVDLFASAGTLRNNFERNPEAWSFRSKMATAGASVRLPANLSVNAQHSVMRLESDAPGLPERRRNENAQSTLTLSKSHRRQTTRLTWREFDMKMAGQRSRQRAVEGEQMVRIGQWTASGAVRWNASQSAQRRDAVFVRGMVQGRVRRMTLHGYTEVGRDLANETLFALNQVQTTVAGVNLPIGRDWSIQGDVLRNHLVTALNPQSVFAMSSHGAPLQMALGGLDRWNVFVRVVRQARWGGPAPAGSVAGRLEAMAPVMGSVEGFVREADGTPGAGIPVVLDGRRVAYTDETGRYRFADVLPGAYRVELSPRALPAEFDPAGTTAETAQVRSAKVARVDLRLERLSALHGQVLGAPGAAVGNLVLRLEGTARATTPWDDGRFAFHNLPAGRYRVVMEQATAPAGYRLAGEDAVEVEVRHGEETPEVFFVFEPVRVEKPVRRVELD